jgi:Fur family zinc uptake transcriptional regulator
MPRSPDRSLAKAEDLARNRGVTMTPIQRQVLQLILASRKPIGAYRLLADLGGKGAKAMPPTVYRALGFLIDHGLIHKIESQSTFIACANVNHPHGGQFAMCTICGRTVEIFDRSLTAELAKKAADVGFTIQRQVVELHGVCADCGSQARASRHGLTCKTI